MNDRSKITFIHVAAGVYDLGAMDAGVVEGGGRP